MKGTLSDEHGFHQIKFNNGSRIILSKREYEVLRGMEPSFENRVELIKLNTDNSKIEAMTMKKLNWRKKSTY